MYYRCLTHCRAMTPLEVSTNCEDTRFDCVVVVAEKPEHVEGLAPAIASSIANYLEVNFPI